MLSLALAAAAHVDVGHNSDSEQILAFVYLLAPVVGQAQVLKEHSGSYVGSPGKRPRFGEVAALVTSYLVGLVATLWLAGRGDWPAVVVVIVAVGFAIVWVTRHWIRRYREDHAFRAPPRVWWTIPLYVSALLLTTGVAVAAETVIRNWWQSR